MTKEALITEINKMSTTRFNEWVVAHQIVERQLGWEETRFEEFWTTFPRKTPSGRILRAATTKAQTAKIALILFKKAVATEEEALIAIRGLKLEIKSRMMANGLEYMNNVQTYIRSKNWELYCDGSTEDISDIDIDLEESSSFDII